VQINFGLKSVFVLNFTLKYGFRLKLKPNSLYFTFYAN